MKELMELARMVVCGEGLIGVIEDAQTCELYDPLDKLKDKGPIATVYFEREVFNKVKKICEAALEA